MEFDYLNSITKSTIVMLLSFPRLCANSVTDVFVGFRAFFLFPYSEIYVLNGFEFDLFLF